MPRVMGSFHSFNSGSREVGLTSLGPKGLVQGEMEQNRMEAQPRSGRRGITHVGAR